MADMPAIGILHLDVIFCVLVFVQHVTLFVLNKECHVLNVHF